MLSSFQLALIVHCHIASSPLVSAIIMFVSECSSCTFETNHYDDDDYDDDGDYDDDDDYDD